MGGEQISPSVAGIGCARGKGKPMKERVCME